MSARVIATAIAILLVATPGLTADQPPAVLFATGWVHNNYVVRPLVGMGIEVDACPPEKMGGILAGGKALVLSISTRASAC